MNGVDKELGGDTGFFLVFSESEQSHTGNDHDRRIRIAQLWRIAGRPILVVLLVLVTVLHCLFRDSSPERLDALARGIPVHKEGADLGTKKMIGTARAQSSQVS